nr:DNA methyltransferase [Sphingomonas sp. IC-11]
MADADGEIIAGHARYEAALRLGLKQVPVIVLDHLSEAAKRAYRIADNRLAEVGTRWSVELLRLEVDTIMELDAGFDISLTGFEAAELDIRFDAVDSKKEQADPPVPEVQASAVTKLGDIWQIGDHRLICGDATLRETYTALLGRERVAMMIGDPPYNVKINGHVSGKGKNKHREFVVASGEMSDAEFRQFLLAFMAQCAAFSKAGALHYVCMDWLHLPQLLSAGSVAYDEYKNLCVWTKSQGGMGSLYRSQHELVAVFKHGTAPHINNIELGKHGRNRTNVWAYAGMNSFGKERDVNLALHPTVKPLIMIRDAILDASNREDLVLDPFGGSGTTLLAADAVNRRARLIELDPLYRDVIVRRAEQALGVVATLAGSGHSFAEVAADRAVSHG